MTTEIVTLKLENMAHGGDAVGHHQGRAILVPLGIPGEVVRAQIIEERKRYALARIVEITQPSPQRVAPPCPYFGRCGGCQWQHLAYGAQLEHKREIVRAQLERIGQQAQPVVRDALGMAEPWAYRNHIQLAMGDEGALGYQSLKSHDIVPVEECALAHPLLDDLWGALDLDFDLRQISLRAGIATGEQMIVFEGVTDELPEFEVDVPVSCLYQTPNGDLTVLAGSSYYHERLAGRTFRVSGPSFFQVNTAQAERMVEVVGRYLALQPGETLLDAYCGVGAFALTLGEQAGRVIGVEQSSWSLDDAEANLEAAGGWEHVEFIEGAVEEALPELDLHCDAAVLDPPRAGCAPEALRAPAQAGPSRIVYVSCDPATLARDVALLAAQSYALVEAQPIDLFPQTYHIETVAWLVRVR